MRTNMKKNSRTITSLAAIGAVILGSILFSVPANAATTAVPLGSTVTDSLDANAPCLAAVALAQKQGQKGTSIAMCASTIKIVAGVATQATTASIQAAQTSLNASDYRSLVAAVSLGAVKQKAYSQTISQITDQETQRGTFFYDGSTAWVTQSYRGHSGTHSCNADYAIGYSVSSTACSDSGSTSSRKLQMNWNISLGLKGGPIAWSESYTMHVNSAGTISNG